MASRPKFGPMTASCVDDVEDSVGGPSVGPVVAYVGGPDPDPACGSVVVHGGGGVLMYT